MEHACKRSRETSTNPHLVATIVEPLRKFHRKRPGRLAAVGTGVSILLPEKCCSLCLPQTLNSVVMYAGHAPKKVNKVVFLLVISTDRLTALVLMGLLLSLSVV